MDDNANHEVGVPLDFESLLRQAISTQQPFYNALLNQMAGVEGRQEGQAKTLMETRDRVNHLWNQELHRQHTELALRIKQLEDERQQRLGVMTAAEWLPKVVQWIAVVVIVVIITFKFEIKVP